MGGLTYAHVYNFINVMLDTFAIAMVVLEVDYLYLFFCCCLYWVLLWCLMCPVLTV